MSAGCGAAIIDYGVGNLFSLKSALFAINARASVTRDPDVIRRADRIILPGVGAFGDAADKFRALGLESVLAAEVAKGKPLLGICVGMQLLFERGYEFGEHKGLGYIKGEVRPLAPDIDARLKIPHVGWNALRFARENDPLLRATNDGSYVYFVHSYYAKFCDDAVVAWTDYGVKAPAIAREGAVWGTQFHPEKSGTVGLSLLSAFCKL